MTTGLASVDYVIIAVSLVAVFAVAIWSSIYKNGSGAESYFLAGRSMPWFICAASIFASNVGKCAKPLLRLGGIQISTCHDLGNLWSGL